MQLCGGPFRSGFASLEEFESAASRVFAIRDSRALDTLMPLGRLGTQREDSRLDNSEGDDAQPDNDDSQLDDSEVVDSEVVDAVAEADVQVPRRERLASPVSEDDAGLKIERLLALRLLPTSDTDDDDLDQPFVRHEQNVRLNAELAAQNIEVTGEAELVISLTVQHAPVKTVSALGVVSLSPYKSNEDGITGRHERQFCFWSQIRPCFDLTTLSESRSSGYWCVLCHLHYEEKFDDIIQHSVDAHGDLADFNLHLQCIYPSDPCDHSERFQENPDAQRFKGLFGSRLFHYLLGSVEKKCYCELLFSTIQHLGVHRLTCDADPATLEGPSLYSYFMHAYGRNYARINMELYIGKAAWLRIRRRALSLHIKDLPSDIFNVLCQSSSKPLTIAFVR